MGGNAYADEKNENGQATEETAPAVTTEETEKTPVITSETDNTQPEGV